MYDYTLTAVAKATEDHRDLPLPPYGYALIAMALFFILFLFTWAFRSVGNKH
jgi:predicted permease